MKRIALGIVVLAACGGKSKPATGAGSGSGPAIYAKKMAVGWGLQATDDQTAVFLQTTDETGKQVSHALGSYEGDCRRITPDPAMNAVTAVACTTADTVVELDAVVHRDAVGGDEVIILRGHRAKDAAPDPMAREEVTRVKAPGGAKLEVAP